MKPPLATSLALLALWSSPLFAWQQGTPAATQTERQAERAATSDVAKAAEPAVKVVDAFSAALAKGNFSEIERILDPSVVILESGGAEHSRSEYLSHHAKADAKFLAGAHIQLLRRMARAEDDLAWVASESEVHVTRDGKPATVRSAESVVLRNTPDGWRIVHIHWSSQPKQIVNQ